MDPDRVAGIKAKLERADEHFEALTTEVRAYFDAQPHSYPVEADFSERTYVMRVRIKAPPARLTVICGDYIQNLRAALDYLVNALVPHSSHKTAFPIYSTARRFDRQVRVPATGGREGPLTGLDPQGEVFGQIESAQPYQSEESEIGTHPLQALAALSNTDKHRTILTVASAHRGDPADKIPDFSFEAIDLEFIGQAVYTYDKVLADGDEVLRGEFIVTGANPEPRITGTLSTDLAFAPDAAYGDASPITTDGLATIRTAVHSICKALALPA